MGILFIFYFRATFSIVYFVLFILSGYIWEEQFEAEDVMCVDWDG